MEKYQLEYVNRQKEDLRKKLERSIETLKVVNTYAPAIVEVVNKFDGKVVNKRLFDAIRGLRSSLVPTPSIHIGFYCHIDKSLNLEVSADRYDRDFNLWCTPVCLTGDDRLIAEAFIKALEERVEYNRSLIERYQTELDNLDSLVEEYCAVYDSIKNFKGKTSGVFRDFLNFQHVH